MKGPRLQAVIALTFFAAAAATAAWPQWLEALGFDPDHGNGSAEWLIVAALAVLAVWSGALATRGLRRARMLARLQA